MAHDIIATRTFDLLAADGTKKAVELHFLRPRQYADDWLCEVLVVGLSAGMGVLRPICGVDAVQAILLAMQFAQIALTSTVEYGDGRLTLWGQTDLNLPSALPGKE